VRAALSDGDVRGRRARPARRQVGAGAGARLAVTMIAAAAAAALPSARAAADGGGATVVLVHPPSATPTVTEALVRLRGELAPARFARRIYESETGPDIRASLEQAAPAVDAVAVVAVLPVGASAAATPGETPDPGAAEVWVVDRVTRK